MPRDTTGGWVRNMFLLRQLENGLARDVTDPFIRALFADIVAQMQRLSPDEVARRAFKVRRIERMLDEIASLVAPRFQTVARDLRKLVAEIGLQQAEFARSQLDLALRGVDVSLGLDAGVMIFRRALDVEPIQGRLFAEWFTDLGLDTERRISREVRLGFAQNETIDQLVRRVRGRSVGGGRYAGGVMDTTTRGATAIVRTAVNHIAASGHMETYQQNADVLAGVEYTATLDSRTSDICISLDGQRWELGDDAIRRPPQHPNCRSVLVPVVDWKGLGVEPPAEGRRASADGPVPASTTYQQWLRDQPASVQDEVLGHGKAKLFRAGELDLRQLVTREGRSLTLAELKDRAA